MTQCRREPLLFSSLGRQQVQAGFAGGKLTSDAGGLLLREVDRRCGLIDALAGCLSDPREVHSGGVCIAFLNRRRQLSCGRRAHGATR